LKRSLQELIIQVELDPSGDHVTLHVVGELH
jgi:hypothetical protein